MAENSLTPETAVETMVENASRWKAFASLKAVTLVLATALTLLGGLGQFLLLETLDGEAAARGNEMRDIEARVTTLRSTQAEFFNAYVQGNLLFALDPTDMTKNRGVTADMYKLALYDRGFPFRSILAELAISGLLQFKSVNDEYNKLADAARTDMSFENYAALNDFEKKILDQALDLQHKLQDRYFVAQSEKADFERQRDNRRIFLLVLSTLGTCLLLAANLMAETRSSG